MQSFKISVSLSEENSNPCLCLNVRKCNDLHAITRCFDWRCKALEAELHLEVNFWAIVGSNKNCIPQQSH